MYKKFDIALIPGKEEENAIRVWYKIPVNKKILAQRGIMKSDCIFSLGETPHCLMENSVSRIDRLKKIDYLFVDFIFTDDMELEEDESLKWKIGKIPIDIRKEEILNTEINIVFIDQRKNIIFSVGKIDFIEKTINIEIFEDYDIKLIGFCN